MDIDEREAALSPFFMHQTDAENSTIADKDSAVRDSLGDRDGHLPTGLDAILAANDVDAQPIMTNREAATPSQITTPPGALNPSEDAVGMWHAEAAAIREADDHAAILAAPRRHNTRVTFSQKLARLAPDTDSAVINVARLIKPQASHHRLTPSKLHERSGCKTENKIASATWRCQMPKTPVQPKKGENFMSWSEHRLDSLTSLIQSLPYPLNELQTWGQERLDVFWSSTVQQRLARSD